MMFLDHYKPAYTTDLKLCEELGLIHKGTVLAADNVIKPGKSAVFGVCAIECEGEEGCSEEGEC
jgi:catechol O-methyltransferase